MLLIATVAGNTGWAKLFAHHPDYAGQLPNYTTAAGGRSFPSSAGFNTTEFFFTDDDGRLFPADPRHEPVHPLRGASTSTPGSRRTGRGSSSWRTGG